MNINNFLGVVAAILAITILNFLGFTLDVSNSPILHVIFGVPAAIFAGLQFRKSLMQAPQDWLRPVRLFGTASVAIYLPVSIFAGLNGATNKFAEQAIALSIMLASLYFCYWLIKRMNSKNTGGSSNISHIRGAKLAYADQVSDMILAEKTPFRLTIGGVPVPANIENYHFLICGTTGTGKSVALTEILDDVTKWNDRIVAADQNCNLVKRYYKEDDFILNPLDVRGVNWSPFAEIGKKVGDIEAMALSLVPVNSQNDEWPGYARMFMEGILNACIDSGKTTNADLRHYVFRATFEELQDFLKDTDAITQVADGGEKMFSNVRTVSTQTLGFLKYLEPTAGSDSFSITDYIKNESSKGNLFITYTDDQLALLKTFISTALDLASRSVTSLQENTERRIWLIADECASLGKIGSLESFLTKARKAGGCAIIGMQTISQFRELYGHHSSETLLGNLSTWLVLRTPNPETAEYMSKYIGDHEIKQIVNSGGETIAEKNSSSNNWSEQIKDSRLVKASELQVLETLVGYLNLAGAYPTCPVQLLIPAPVSNPTTPFVAKDFKAQKEALKAKKQEAETKVAEAFKEADKVESVATETPTDFVYVEEDNPFA